MVLLFILSVTATYILFFDYFTPHDTNVNNLIVHNIDIIHEENDSDIYALSNYTSFTYDTHPTYVMTINDLTSTTYILNNTCINHRDDFMHTLLLETYNTHNTYTNNITNLTVESEEDKIYILYLTDQNHTTWAGRNHWPSATRPRPIQRGPW